MCNLSKKKENKLNTVSEFRAHLINNQRLKIFFLKVIFLIYFVF